MRKSIALRCTYAAISLLPLAALVPPAQANIIEFDGTPSLYTVTPIEMGGSTVTMNEVAGNLQMTGLTLSNTAPKLDLRSTSTVTCDQDWIVETRLNLASNVFAHLANRDSIQVWLTVKSTLDTDDSTYAKVGIIKGGFEFGGQTVPDSYFVSSAYDFDQDQTSGSANGTEWRNDVELFPDTSLPGPFSLRVQYDRATDSLSTSYQLGSQTWVNYTLTDSSSGQPGVTSPRTQWGLQDNTPLEISIMVSPTKGASIPGESNGLSSDLMLMPGDVEFDYLLIESASSDWVSFDSWIAGPSGQFAGQTDPLVIGLTADPDNDSNANVLEFLTGGDASATSSINLGEQVGDEGGQDFFEVSFLARRSPLVDWSISLESSPDLAPGSWATANPIEQSVEHLDPIFERRIYRFGTELSTHFFRLAADP